MKQSVTVVGDGIENPANALTMIHAAHMFGATCRFRDTKGLAEAVMNQGAAPAALTTIAQEELRVLHSRRIAFDNLPGAAEVYGFQAGRDFAVLVGNERRGLSHEFATLATDRVQVPMISRRINCLNVAAASAVALYYLCGTRVGRMTVRNEPGRRRPELLFLGPGDHVELGSAIRSATAFGWQRALIEDRHQVWFNCERGIRSEGRAAARRGRNEILLIPCSDDARHAFMQVTVITIRREGIPIHRVNLTRGASQLVVIPDEGATDLDAELWSRLGAEVEFARLQIPEVEFTYHYRLVATIALAEISRQVGRRPSAKIPAAPGPPIYDHKLARRAEQTGQWISLQELMHY
jgi:tRNA G18 (ribose-2'-O)-methylase SpoU